MIISSSTVFGNLRMKREIRGFDWLKHANYYIELHNNPSGDSLQTTVISFYTN